MIVCLLYQKINLLNCQIEILSFISLERAEAGAMKAGQKNNQVKSIFYNYLKL